MENVCSLNLITWNIIDQEEIAERLDMLFKSSFVANLNFITGKRQQRIREVIDD